MKYKTEINSMTIANTKLKIDLESSQHTYIKLQNYLNEIKQVSIDHTPKDENSWKLFILKYQKLSTKLKNQKERVQSLKNVASPLTLRRSSSDSFDNEISSIEQSSKPMRVPPLPLEHLSRSHTFALSSSSILSLIQEDFS